MTENNDNHEDRVRRVLGDVARATPPPRDRLDEAMAAAAPASGGRSERRWPIGLQLAGAAAAVATLVAVPSVIAANVGHDPAPHSRMAASSGDARDANKAPAPMAPGVAAGEGKDAPAGIPVSGGAIACGGTTISPTDPAVDPVRYLPADLHGLTITTAWANQDQSCTASPATTAYVAIAETGDRVLGALVLTSTPNPDPTQKSIDEGFTGDRAITSVRIRNVPGGVVNLGESRLAFTWIEDDRSWTATSLGLDQDAAVKQLDSAILDGQRGTAHLPDPPAGFADLGSSLPPTMPHTRWFAEFEGAGMQFDLQVSKDSTPALADIVNAASSDSYRPVLVDGEWGLLFSSSGSSAKSGPVKEYLTWSPAEGILATLSGGWNDGDGIDIVSMAKSLRLVAADDPRIAAAAVPPTPYPTVSASIGPAGPDYPGTPSSGSGSVGSGSGSASSGRASSGFAPGSAGAAGGSNAAATAYPPAGVPASTPPTPPGGGPTTPTPPPTLSPNNAPATPPAADLTATAPPLR